MDKHNMAPNSISDKKKRGRKKNIVVETTNTISSKQTFHEDQDQNQDQNQDNNNNNENVVVVVEMTKEKKQRKKRTTKGEAANANDTDAGADMTETILEIANVNEPTIKKRKRRTRKDIENAQNADKNLIISSTNTGTEHHAQAHGENSSDTQLDESAPKEEKVAKKRGRKPKGGKITIQPQTNGIIQNELPNIILHLKCSLSDLNKNNSEIDETFDTKNNSNNAITYTNANVNNNTNANTNTNTNNNTNANNNNNTNANTNASCNTNMETIQSYNSINAIGSEINNNTADDGIVRGGSNIQLYHRDLLKKSQYSSNVHEMITKDDSHSRSTNANTNGAANALNETYSSAIFPVYDPCIPNDTNTHSLPPPITRSMHSYYDGSNQIINKNQASPFSTIYSPDIISYNNNTHTPTHTSTHDDDSLSNSVNLNERDIWKKINQLKLSFHKSDICQNIRGAQRSACFWCTCEFDSPAIYIPKSVLKDMYNVYGCFCSPECGAAFLMNESIDTSTKFERYHLLNSLYGKIYKHEKSIKIAPNPYYLLNKFYGTLTIQEYRKLFQSDQMIYVVNKPLTHILPELYEDNNDFLLNNKIIPTNSVNLKRKVLKSNL
jgi:hypothetical protein